MGLLQKLVETYDCHESLAGKYLEDAVVLAPIGHRAVRAQVEITLDEDGKLCSAEKISPSAPEILIPVTEQSVSRTSTKICPNPLCEKLQYLIPEHKEHFDAYCKQLENWNRAEDSHPMLTPILTYVKSGTLAKDLARWGIIQLDKNGMPQKEDMIVCWRVLGVSAEDACWKNQDLIRAYIRYYRKQAEGGELGVCMISGKTEHLTDKHPKTILPFHSNAKLISSNDKSNFTFRGRFSQSWQAATVGYDASQKIHSTLRWLADENNQGVQIGGRTFICWNPQGKTIPGQRPDRKFPPFYPILLPEEKTVRPSDYQQKLQNTLFRCENELPSKSNVVIMVADAANKGRMAILYYKELSGSDFLKRLYEWDQYCCWPTQNFGIKAPSLKVIVSCAFGVLRKKNNTVVQETNEKLMRQQIQRLMVCRVDSVKLQYDLVKALMAKAVCHLAHEKAIEDTIYSTACAVIRKYRFDRFKEEWNMTLEPEKRDISYQYGCLLAVMEKVERDTYDMDTDREPNAIRQQSVFCQRPMYAAANIQKQLDRAYFPKLRSVKKRAFYRSLIGEIMEKINEFPENLWNRPLRETYLMGYYLQRSALYTKKNNENNETEEENDG